MSEHLVESRHQTIAATIDALTGAITPDVLTTETVTIDPLTGTKNYAIVTRMIRTADGRSVKPDAANQCRCCNAVISSTATKQCTTCTVTLCSSCAGNPAFCNHCRWNDRIRRFFTWLKKLSNDNSKQH
jgi:hypothetical protein